MSTKVTGDGMVRDSSFDYTVTLSDPSVNGPNGEMEFTDGVATFSLKDGESKTTEELPAGVTWTVQETNANQYGYEIEEETQTGVISGDTEVEFDNKRANAILSVTVNSPGENEYWGLGSENNNKKLYLYLSTVPYSGNDPRLNGKLDGLTITNGTSTEFTLRDGEAREFLIPEGVNASLRTNNSYSGLTLENIESPAYQGFEKGKTYVQKCLFHVQACKVTFTKKLVGDDNSSKEFKINLKPNYTNFINYHGKMPSGKYSSDSNDGIVFEGEGVNTIGTVTVTAAENKVLFVPYGSYSVTEDEADAAGYTVSYSKKSLSVSNGVSLTVTNTKNDSTLASTNGTNAAKAASGSNEPFDFVVDIPYDGDDDDIIDADVVDAGTIGKQTPKKSGKTVEDDTTETA